MHRLDHTLHHIKPTHLQPHHTTSSASPSVQLHTTTSATSMSSSTPLDGSRFLDLTHTLHEDMPVWEPGQTFRSKQVMFVDKEGAAIHEYTIEKGGVGTHFDSAGHFCLNRRMVHEYGPKDLVCPLRVIDVQAHAERDRDYQTQAQDILNHEKEHGKIPAGAAVIINNGWTQYWSDPTKCMNFDDKHVRHFPGFGLKSVELLWERRVNGVGTDTMSLDAGNNAAFEAHYSWLNNNGWGLENVKIVQGLPAAGATLVVSPMNVLNGSEAPARVYAYV